MHKHRSPQNPTHYRSLGQSVYFCECFHIHRIVKAAIFYCLSLRWLLLHTNFVEHIYKRNIFISENVACQPIKCTHNFLFNSIFFISFFFYLPFRFEFRFLSPHWMLDAKSKWPNGRWRRLSTERVIRIDLLIDWIHESSQS